MNADFDAHSLRTKLSELEGRDRRLVVETRSSDAELGNGSALVSVDQAAMSWAGL